METAQVTTRNAHLHPAMVGLVNAFATAHAAVSEAEFKAGYQFFPQSLPAGVSKAAHNGWARAQEDARALAGEFAGELV